MPTLERGRWKSMSDLSSSPHQMHWLRVKPGYRRCCRVIGAGCQNLFTYGVRRSAQAILSCTSPTVIFTHFLVINAVAARMSGEDTVLQCLPANGSVHHLRVEDQAWRWISRGDMLESVVN